jgi:hypothetical protein
MTTQLGERIENGMIEPAWKQDQRERFDNLCLDDEFPEPDFYMELAADLIRTDWKRIKAEKGE